MSRGKYPVAGADLVQLMDQFDGVFDCSGAGVGAVVFGFILFQHAWKTGRGGRARWL